MPYALSENYFIQLLGALKEKFLDAIKVGNIGEEIKEAITSKEVFSIKLGEFNFSVADTVISTWIAMAFIAIMAFWMGRTFNLIPKGKQIISESYVGLIMNLCQSQNMNEKQAAIVAPYIGSIGIFIAISNCFSVFGIEPPSKDPVFPITLAIFTVFYVIFTGIRLVGIKGFWGSLVYPKAVLLPFRVLDYFIKPISLSLRLFGNIFGAFILMKFVYIVIPFIVPGVLGIWFDFIDGLLQGAVFAYLSAVYVGEIIEGATETAKTRAENKKLSGEKAPKIA